MTDLDTLALDSLPSLSKGLTEEQINKISDLSKEGYQLIKKENLSEALNLFKEILSIDENNNYALVGIGDILRKTGKPSQAILYYQKCLLSYPNNNYALFGLADCYKMLKNYSKAIDIWETYLNFDNKNITVLTRLADAYRKVGVFNKSKEVYLRTLEINEDNEYAFIGLGHLFYDFKEYEQALYYWNQVYEKYQDYVDVRVLTSIGNCHRKLKQYEEGVKFFNKALEFSPNNFYALFGLGDSYRGLDLHEEAKGSWESILKRDPSNKVVLTRLGDTHRSLNSFPEAEKYYKKALDLEFDAYASLGLAIIYKESQKLDQSISLLTELLSLNPKNSRIYLELSECYELKEDYSQAVKILYQFLQTGMTNFSIIDRYESLKKKYEQQNSRKID